MWVLTAHIPGKNNDAAYTQEGNLDYSTEKNVGQCPLKIFPIYLVKQMLCLSLDLISK